MIPDDPDFLISESERHHGNVPMTLEDLELPTSELETHPTNVQRTLKIRVLSGLFF
jgi:hypothetical protein